MPELRKLAAKLQDLGAVMVTLTGGEPLLREDFGRIYRRARSGGLLVTVFTNATMVTPETVRLFRDLPSYDLLFLQPQAIQLYPATQRKIHKH